MVGRGLQYEGDHPMSDADVRMFRAKYQMSQAELARRIGISPTTLHRWENRFSKVPAWGAILIRHEDERLSADTVKPRF